MFRNYLRIAYRNGIRHKSFLLLSVTSLAVALGSAILVGLYARQEFSYDRFHRDADDVYRLVVHSRNQDVERSVGFVPLALAPHLAERFPSVEDYARVWVYRREMPVARLGHDVDFYEARFAWADPSFFDLFDFPITAGRADDPLAAPDAVVLSESMARKYFGDADPVGQTLHFRGGTDIALQVTAVMADFPLNSHLQFDFVAHIKTAEQQFWGGGGGTADGWLEEWVNLFVPAYVRVRPGADVGPLLEEATRQVNEHLGQFGAVYTVSAQSLPEIHLTSRLDVGEFGPNGSLRNTYALLGIGLIILLLGCFNFVNLLTAQASRRTKEVGLRKALGGTRPQLILQYYLEATGLVGLSLATALVGVAALLPLLRPFLPTDGLGTLLADPLVLSALVVVFAGVALAAGAYPALFVSRFAPARVFKGLSAHTLGGGGLRKVLVTTQFAMSAGLIVCTLVVYQQLRFMQEKDLGFARDQILVIPIHNDSAVIPNLPTLKQAFGQHSDVRGVTASSHLPLAPFTYQNTFLLPGADREHRWERYTVETDYADVYDLALVAGRSFRPGARADSHAVILNERAAAELGLTPEEAVGRRLVNRSMETEGLIVGVARDFHFQSLHESIQPFVLMHEPETVDFISVRIAPGRPAETVAQLERTWKQTIPEASFGAYFLDDAFDAAYVHEERLNALVVGLSLIAVFLAGLGLFGLSLFAAERRTKEIGVRKVLGATVGDVLRLLGGEFGKLVGLGLVVGLPAAYGVMTRWLDAYAYRIELSWPLFALAGLSVLALALVAAGYHCLRVATADPVRALRYE